MKLKFFIFLIGFFSFFHLNAATAPDVSSAFAFNPEGLAKPAAMGCMVWIDALETERNKADCMGDFQAFKAFSKEISATIGGKYGISTRVATPEEQAALIYSITRTRHKFCGQENMLTTHYGVGEVSGLECHVKGHFAAVLAVDIMVKKAMDNEDFANQWIAIQPVTPAAASFITSVKQYAGTHEKASVVAALQEQLDIFLTSGDRTISLANDVFNIFAPKLTLAKINAHRAGGTYGGWNMHGTDAFFSPVSLTALDKAKYPGLESELRDRYESMVEEFLDVYSYSAVAGVSPDSKTITMEYLFDECVDELTENNVHSAPRQLSLIRSFNPLLAGILKRPHYKTPQSAMLSIYKNEFRLANKLANNVNPLEEILFLVAHGIPCDAMELYAVWLLNGQNGVRMDVAKAIECCRDGASVGWEPAQEKLPAFIYSYGAYFFNGEKGVRKNIPEAISYISEAASLGDKDAKEKLPILLHNYSVWLFKGEKGITQDIPKAIEFCREAAALKDKDAIRNLPLMIAELEETTMAAAKAAQPFRGNWTRTFQTKVGPILHTPGMTQWGGMTCGKSLHLASKTLNGIPLKAPLILETNSTESEFLAALRLSGLID